MDLQIPVVDLNDLRSVNDERRQRAGEALRVAFSQYGLAYIQNHGVSREDVLALYEQFMDVLRRPQAEKATWGGPDIWYQRGWTPPNTEQAVVAGGQPDFKECYFAAPVPLDKRCRSYWPQIYNDNVWPDSADSYRDAYLGLGRTVHGVGMDLLRGCALALGMRVDTLTSRCEGGAHVTRLLRYLALSEGQLNTGVLWGEEHTDFNLLTLLPGGVFYKHGEQTGDRPADFSGLKLRTRPTPEHPDGQLVSGVPPKGCMVAQVGQQLEVLSGGRFLATPHGIHAPGELGWERTSFAHFVHLNGMQTVAPLGPFRDADSIYAPPVLAGTYAMKTLVDIGLAPPSTMDQFGYRQYDRLAQIREDD
ncbi:MAG: isopenicillin N synthase family oxygenase [Rhodobacterales bacterium]|nr:isopenicillin N synthase family oxygenase [Rhodobacterales bacterium]